MSTDASPARGAAVPPDVARGRTVERVTRTFLCRCGLSQNKPYCDSSHKAAGFVAAGG